MLLKSLGALSLAMLGATFLFLVMTGVKMQTLPLVSEKYVHGNETMQAPEHPRFYRRTSTFLLSRTVSIKKPASDVYSAVLSPKLWTLCYPETLGVGGVSRHQVEPGDVIIEKFFFNGMYYAVFKYNVEKVDVPKLVRFHGIIIFANSLILRSFQWVLDEIGGSFEYSFVDKDNLTTEWRRDLYLYTTGDSWLSRFMFWTIVTWTRHNQERGATQFLECAKLMLETFDREIWIELKD